MTTLLLQISYRNISDLVVVWNQSWKRIYSWASRDTVIFWMISPHGLISTAHLKQFRCDNVNSKESFTNYSPNEIVIRDLSLKKWTTKQECKNSTEIICEDYDKDHEFGILIQARSGSAGPIRWDHSFRTPHVAGICFLTQPSRFFLYCRASRQISSLTYLSYSVIMKVFPNRLQPTDKPSPNRRVALRIPNRPSHSYPHGKTS